jgi:soluble lytic murein transglycosylase-like protein
MSLILPHRKVANSVLWTVGRAGVALENGAKVFRTKGKPSTVRRIWQEFEAPIRAAGTEFAVPVQILVATAATESRGDPGAVRHEPGYAISLVEGLPNDATLKWLNGNHGELPLAAFAAADDETPHRVSPGIMQTLISTAREALHDPSLGRVELLSPDVSIAAAAAYIRSQADRDEARATFMDPVLVAAAYNAGSLRKETATANPWRLRCYPLNTGKHISRFVEWYGDACAVTKP